MSMYRKLLFAAGLLSMLSLVARGTESPPDPPAARQEFIAAMQRVRLHQPDQADSPALKAFVIYDYLLSARLRRDLAQNPNENLDATIDGFVQQHAGQPVTRPLRHDWLISLAQRTRWDWFLPRSIELADPVLICDRLEGRLATGDLGGLSASALARWMLPQKQPTECSAVFAWLGQQGLLTAVMAESRARAALGADNARLAREFAADVPIEARAPLLQWSDLLENPRSALNVLATHPALPVEPEALAAGFEKMARSDPGAALELLPRLLDRKDLNPATQGKLKRAAALSAAYDRDPRALTALDNVPSDAADGQVQEWRVRSALWNHDYVKARIWIEQMPASLATQPRWRYWHARVVAITEGEAAAAPLFAEVSDIRDYYGYLAADRLHQSYDLNMLPTPSDAATQGALAASAGMIRAHALFDCDMADEAAVEWAVEMSGATSALKIQAARLAARWGWYAQSIATLAQTGEFDDVMLRYPRPFLDAVKDASQLTQVPPDWILAVMRQESLFRKDAVSRADARGIMQMMPSTASAVARRWHLAPPGREGLFDPAVAVPLGAAYFHELLDRYHGQLVLTLAAYNAGPAAAARWLPDSTMDTDIWIENIPYNETRGYVQHILEHIIAFAAVRGAALPRLYQLSASVEPFSAL
jgi:soluble lytic murein transglycosylase